VKRAFEALVREYFPRDTEQVLADFYAVEARILALLGVVPSTGNKETP
jgi:hypothetical protein